MFHHISVSIKYIMDFISSFEIHVHVYELYSIGFRPRKTQDDRIIAHYLIFSLTN